MATNPYFNKLLVPADQKQAQLEARKQRALELIKQSQTPTPEGEMIGGGGGDSHFGARPSIYVAPDPLEHVNKLLGDTLGTLELKNVAKATDANTEATRQQNTTDWENATNNGAFDPVAASRSSDPELRKAALTWYANEPERAEKARKAKGESQLAIGQNHEKQSDLVAKAMAELDTGMDKRRLEAKNDADRKAAVAAAKADRWAMHDDTIANRVPPSQFVFMPNADGNIVALDKRNPNAPAIQTSVQKPPDSQTVKGRQAAVAGINAVDQALLDVEAAPKAFGLVQGAAGGTDIGASVLNAYSTPSEVAARASVANIGSQIIHDRSGAAVTISETPRLKPFIPSAADKPEVIKTKLGKLREQMERDGYSWGAKAGSLAARPAPKAPKPTGTPRVTSRAQAEALPKGTVFIDPNGVTRTR